MHTKRNRLVRAIGVIRGSFLSKRNTKPNTPRIFRWISLSQTSRGDDALKRFSRESGLLFFGSRLKVGRHRQLAFFKIEFPDCGKWKRARSFAGELQLSGEGVIFLQALRSRVATITENDVHAPAELLVGGRLAVDLD